MGIRLHLHILHAKDRTDLATSVLMTEVTKDRSDQGPKWSRTELDVQFGLSPKWPGTEVTKDRSGHLPLRRANHNWPRTPSEVIKGLA